MRLCINCENYTGGTITKCEKDHWIASDPVKTKIFNPMMFECFDYDAKDDKPNFGNDHLFDLVLEMVR